ncbi:MAG: TetR/AcrR family transcriptional regulator [Rhizobiaceae bacterium]|nr:TetR/AcrR family transcriptional regulator [Rhizobiaceae bacterium]
MNDATLLKTAPDSETSDPSKREQEVLDAVLDLMVEEGDRFSMASVAKRASCSKETLYRWFGDRDGLLTATVQWQASKVVMPRLDPHRLELGVFKRTLREFAGNWLKVITGDVSIALNRLAVSHAGNRETRLGEIVLENGPLTMRQRLEPIFALGRKAGYLTADDDTAFRTFFGLVVADTQIRALLGDTSLQAPGNIETISQRAVDQFMALCNQT